MKGFKYIDRPNSFPSPYIGLCISEKSFNKEMKRLEVDAVNWIKNSHSDATTHFLECGRKTTVIVCLRLRKGVVHNEVISLLIHEAVHIWQEIRTNIGERYPSSEFEAYTIQHIAQKLIFAYDELRKAK